MTTSKPFADSAKRTAPDASQLEADENSPTFEYAMGELEGIVRRLETGGEPLEKALEDYSSAIGLLKVCHQKLEQAERRVEILSGIDAEGNPVTEPVEEIEETLDEKRHTRDTKRTAGKTKRSGSAGRQKKESATRDPEDPGLF